MSRRCGTGILPACVRGTGILPVAETRGPESRANSGQEPKTTDWLCHWSLSSGSTMNAAGLHDGYAAGQPAGLNIDVIEGAVGPSRRPGRVEPAAEDLDAGHRSIQLPPGEILGVALARREQVPQRYDERSSTRTVSRAEPVRPSGSRTSAVTA
jgi:hypothetical protein